MIEGYQFIPSRGLADSVNSWLLESIRNKVSDITFMPNQKAQGEANGARTSFSAGTLTQSELQRLIVKTYGEAAATRVPSQPLDYAFEVLDHSDRSRRRFRFNVSWTFSGGQWGYHISIRVLDLQPPSFKQIGLKEELVKSIHKDRGMVLVGGGTGHGKSTTLAAILRYILQTQAIKLVTIEAPIEYVYDELPDLKGYACQHQVGSGIKTFNHGLVNALRQKPDCILVGEIRDRETAETSIEASLTGHPLFATIHANSASEILSRVVEMFHPSEKRAKSMDFLRNTSVVIAQRLLPKIGGGRIAVRECFTFDENSRRELAKTDPEKWAYVLDDWLECTATSMAHDMEKLVNQNLIAEEWLTWSKK